MPDKKPVVVYGVSGYTGRLVCEYLREYNIPFVAAGRDKKRVQDVVDKIPGIETANYEVVEVEHNRHALAELFRGAQIVSNMVGPFIKYGAPGVGALEHPILLAGRVGIVAFGVEAGFNHRIAVFDERTHRI